MVPIMVRKNSPRRFKVTFTVVSDPTNTWYEYASSEQALTKLVNDVREEYMRLGEKVRVVVETL